MALAISWGYANVSEAVEWADEQIALSRIPDHRLTEISLAKSVSEAVTPLNSLSKDVDIWVATTFFLRRFLSQNEMQPAEASKLAERLFYLAIDKDAPEPFQRLAYYWDEIDLAVDGVYGDPKVCVAEFLGIIKSVAAPYASSG